MPKSTYGNYQGAGVPVQNKSTGGMTDSSTGAAIDPNSFNYGGQPGASFQQGQDYRQQAAKSAMLAGSRAEDAYNAYGKQMRDYRQSAAQGLLAQQRGIGQQFGNAAIAAGRGGGGAYAGNNMQQQFGAMGVEAAEMQGLAATKAMEMGNINQDRQVKTANYEKNIASMVENFSKGRNRPEDFIRAMDWRIQLEQDPVMRQWLEKRKREGLQQMASWF